MEKNRVTATDEETHLSIEFKNQGPHPHLQDRVNLILSEVRDKNGKRHIHLLIREGWATFGCGMSIPEFKRFVRMIREFNEEI